MAFKLNPNASSFVPSWANPPPPAAAQAPAAAQTQTTVPAARAPAPTVSKPAQESWEDDDTSAPAVVPAPVAPKSDEPPKPTESVFVVEEDDLEDEGTQMTRIL